VWTSWTATSFVGGISLLEALTSLERLGDEPLTLEMVHAAARVSHGSSLPFDERRKVNIRPSLVEVQAAEAFPWRVTRPVPARTRDHRGVIEITAPVSWRKNRM
jgi:hypothetical protein